MYFNGRLKKIQRFFCKETVHIITSWYSSVVKKKLEKIYGREINGINQGSYLKQLPKNMADKFGDDSVWKSTLTIHTKCDRDWCIFFSILVVILKCVILMLVD